jgi:uncharacterized protein (TIGR03067 family)
MISLNQFVVLLPLLISVQPTISEVETRERQSAIHNLERDGLPLAAILDAPDVQVKAALAGTWQASYFEYSGFSRPEIASGIQMKFTRGHLQLLQRGRPPIVVAYNVNPDRTPAGFVWRLPDGGITFQDGVYYLEGDTLVICLGRINGTTASQFVTQPGDGRSLYVLRRTSN